MPGVDRQRDADRPGRGVGVEERRDRRTARSASLTRSVGNGVALRPPVDAADHVSRLAGRVELRDRRSVGVPGPAAAPPAAPVAGEPVPSAARIMPCRSPGRAGRRVRPGAATVERRTSQRSVLRTAVSPGMAGRWSQASRSACRQVEPRAVSAGVPSASNSRPRAWRRPARRVQQRVPDAGQVPLEQVGEVEQQERRSPLPRVAVVTWAGGSGSRSAAQRADAPGASNSSHRGSASGTPGGPPAPGRSGNGSAAAAAWNVSRLEVGTSPTTAAGAAAGVAVSRPGTSGTAPRRQRCGLAAQRRRAATLAAGRPGRSPRPARRRGVPEPAQHEPDPLGLGRPAPCGRAAPAAGRPARPPRG